MSDFDTLFRKRAAFHSPTGINSADFTTLGGRFADAATHAAPSTTVRDAAPRRRVPGAGRRFCTGVSGRLLMALVWLRTHPTYEVLGYFFDLY